MPSMGLITSDITQVCLQIQSELEREVFIRAPPEIGIPLGTVLKVVKPLYGGPDSGLNWYLTYTFHHIDYLAMKRAMVDPCMLMKHTDGCMTGGTLLQVDDSLNIGPDTFMKDDDNAVQRFRTKLRKLVSDNITLFNGFELTMELDGTVKTTQNSDIDSLKEPRDANIS